MKHTPDLTKFESLSGVDFTRYVVAMKDIIVGDDFLNYFIERKCQMDDVHLELALYWLGKNGSLAAYDEIAKYIDHTNQTFRFLAVGFITEMTCEVDAFIMSRVIEVLDRNSFPQDRKALTSVLKKTATKDAQILATRYLTRK
jgi:hypothetical protein